MLMPVLHGSNGMSDSLPKCMIMIMVIVSLYSYVCTTSYDAADAQYSMALKLRQLRSTESQSTVLNRKENKFEDG